MHDHFVSSVFCICPKTPLSIFTSQKISQISRDFICSPLSNRVWTEEISSDIHQNIQNYYFNTHNFDFFQKNIIISKSATIYHCSSTMAHGIGQDHKPEKKNKKWLYNTTYPSSAPWTPCNRSEERGTWGRVILIVGLASEGVLVVWYRR